MLRQLSSGNNRDRGLKPKDALQISLIFAVSIWILYHLTYTYQNNSIIDGYMQVNVHQEFKIKQESGLDFSGDPGTGTTDTRNAVGFEKEERKIVGTMHEDKGKSENVVKKNDIEKGGEIEDIIKEHEARERSFKDDDASSAVFHDNQIPETKEELTSGTATYSRNQNMTNDDDEFDFILGNGTINETSLEKKSISYLGNFSDKPDGIEHVGKHENVSLVDLNETYMVEGSVRDATAKRTGK